MFNIGPTELMVILVLALIVFGPKKLPEMGRSIGKGLREFRKAQMDIKREKLHGIRVQRVPRRRTAGARLSRPSSSALRPRSRR